MEISDAEYRKLVLEVAAARQGVADAPAKKRGFIQRVWGVVIGALWLALAGLVIAVFAFALRIQYGVPVPIPDALVRTAAVTFSTAAAPSARARVERDRPAQQPGGLGGAPAWPTLTPTSADEPTPMPTDPASFWTPEEKTAFSIAATATDVAFYDAQTLPTAPPEFVKAVEDDCADPERVAESATLQLFCKK